MPISLRNVKLMLYAPNTFVVYVLMFFFLPARRHCAFTISWPVDGCKIAVASLCDVSSLSLCL